MTIKFSRVILINKYIDLARAKSEALDNIYSLLKQIIKSCHAKGDVTRDDSATTIFSATQRSNVGTMLQPFETMSQQCFKLCWAKSEALDNIYSLLKQIIKS